MKSILLVEDDPFLIDIYTTKFSESGFKVEVAADGEECLKKIAEAVPDIVLLDIVLPKMDGWEVLKTIKADEKTKQVKVIVLSNLGQKGEVEKGLSLGASHYLIKAHHTPSEVVTEVEKLLE